ncbi:hypothetical protein [Vogesella mureinivorans]|uniref:hypothetical protein n=1 Tax=Vogesella mureinivorans TaxID=657276 RepID=UPI0011CB1EBD|nr:hypothetical protein [Vogesella mureinivorans]
MSLSFTYFEAEDRLLVLIQPGGHQLWLTRYLTQSILRDIAALFARAVPGEGVQGAGSSEQRIALEHRMAMNEEDLADQPGMGGGMKFAHNSPALPASGSIPVCTGLDAQAGSDYASISFTVGPQNINMRQSRAGFHRFLRTLALCANKAGWQIQDVPGWLTQSLLTDLLGTLPPLDEPDSSDDNGLAP